MLSISNVRGDKSFADDLNLNEVLLVAEWPWCYDPLRFSLCSMICSSGNTPPLPLTSARREHKAWPWTGSTPVLALIHTVEAISYIYAIYVGGRRPSLDGRASYMYLEHNVHLLSANYVPVHCLPKTCAWCEP